MDVNAWKAWLELVKDGVELIAVLVVALWAYTKYVVERGLLPPVQFDIDCNAVGLQGDQMVLEILLHLKNLGNSTLVATNLEVTVRYLQVTDKPNVYKDAEKSTFGRLQFPLSLRDELQSSDTKDQHSFAIMSHDPLKKGRPYDTFVQSKVDQVYTFVTAVPKSTTYVLIHSSFKYAQRATLFQQIILYLSRRLGLLQFSLDHIRMPHTVERVFKVSQH